MDIKLSDGKFVFNVDSKSIIAPHKWTSSMMERQLKAIKYKKPNKRYRNKVVEHSKMPPFNESLLVNMIANSSIPSNDQFVELYLYSFFDEEGEKVRLKEEALEKGYNFQGKKAAPKSAVVYRVANSYASIIRDIHMTLKLTEQYGFNNVLYSLENDRNGIDVTFEYKKAEYGLRLDVLSRRSKAFHDKKTDFRHNYDKNVLHLELDLSDSRNLKIGNSGDKLLLYGEHHIQKLFSMLNRNKLM